MREFNRREFLVGMTGTGLAVVLAACTPTQQPTQPSQPAGGLAKEQVIRIPLTEPPTLDPGLATDTVSLDVIVQLFDGLVGFDDAGNIFGIHAEKWDVSSDGITYTFYLRPGIKWSNGRPITAQDYEWAWKRNIDPKTASDYATTLFPIKNAQAIHEGKANPQTLGVRARDDRTLEVTLEAPAAYFLRLASTWTMFPLPREAIEKYGDKWTEAGNIVTNGAFKMSSWRHQQEIVLERNEDYWGKKPTLQRAVYRIFPEGAEEQVLAAYENDELDVARGIPPAQVDRILNDPKFKDQIKIFDQSGTMFIAVNNRRPHLRDPRVRKALGMTLERQVLIDRVLKVVAKPAYSLQPPGIMGRNPDIWPKEDVEAARRLMADAGYPNGQGFPEITFTYNTSAAWKALGEYLQQRWQQTLGIKVKLQEMEWRVFLQWRRTPEASQTYDVYRGGWLSDYEDPNNWYNVLWDSAEDPGVFNLGWKNPDYDRIVRQARAELDQQKRAQLYAQAEKILADEYPAIPVYHYGARHLVKPWVKNWTISRILGFAPLRDVQILAR
ncbi:MAG: peptide ABC transporter substrate-binding protein [Chloroflexota bacterium]